MPIYQNLYQTLLPCPIVELRGYLAACGLRGRLYAYLDYNGPTGTARDNLAEGMLALADERGALKPGQPVIEASSGAFALALTLAGQTAGHPVVLTMPEDAPALRQEQLLRLGAKILHVPARGGLSAARALARKTAAPPISAGLPQRPSGMRSMIWRLRASSACKAAVLLVAI